MGKNTYDTLKMLYLSIKVFGNKFGIRRKETGPHLCEKDYYKLFWFTTVWNTISSGSTEPREPRAGHTNWTLVSICKYM